MDEVLKKRVAGALVLLAIAFVVSLLLPEPGPAPRGGGVQRVTIDLTAPPAPPVTVPAPAASALPQTIAGPPREVAGEPAAATAVAEENEPGAMDGAAVETPMQAAPAPAPVQAERRPPPAAPQPARPAVSAAKTEPEPPAAPAPPTLVLSEKLASTAPPAAQAASPEAPLERRWIVQVGSFAHIDNARSVQDALKGAGYPSIISPAETANGTLYRVRVGPYAGREQAGEVRGKLAQLGYAQSTVQKR